MNTILNRYILPRLFAILLLGLYIVTPASSSDAIKLLPDNFLTVGNQWQYNLHVTEVDGNPVNFNGTHSWTVSGTEVVKGYDTYVVQEAVNIPGIMNETSTMNWFQTPDYLAEVRWEDAEDYEEVRSNNPNGNPWELMPVYVADTANNLTFGYGEYAGAMKVPPNYTWTGNQTSKITFIGAETITVPAGTFNCIKVYLNYTWTDDSGWHGFDELWLWMDKDTGFVKLEINGVEYDNNNNLNESGRYTMELTGTNFSPPTLHQLIPDNFLTVGNQWQYNLHVTEVDGNPVNFNGTHSWTVSGTEVVKGYDTYVVQEARNIPGIVNETSTMNWFQTPDYLVEVRWEDAEDYEEVRSNNPNGNPWELMPVYVADTDNNLTFGYGEYAGAMKVPPNYTWTGNQTGKITFIGAETITVPAGTFNCIKVYLNHTWIDDSGWHGFDELWLWMDKDTGIVKLEINEVEYDNNNNLDESKRYTMELTGVANLIGDINNDAQVNIEDVIASLQILSGIPIEVMPNMTLSDVNKDNKIGMAEVIYLLQKISGLRTK